MSDPVTKLIQTLEEQTIGPFETKLMEVEEGRFTAEANFQLAIQSKQQSVSNRPFVTGKYFKGMGKHYNPWIEFSYKNHLSFGNDRENTISVREEQLEEPLFQLFAGLLPSGSHIMVGYANHKETRTGLEHEIPPPATPIGFLLWKIGCTWFKDWYIAEGFAEGEVKLQGNIAPDPESRKRQKQSIYNDLEKFRDQGTDQSNSVMQKALSRAEQILNEKE